MKKILTKKNNYFKKPFLFFESLLKSILATLKQPVFLIFPLLLILFFYFPNEPVKFILKLNISKPEIWQFFTSSLVHKDISHLNKNLFIYFFLIFLISFCVFYKINEMKTFSISFFFILLFSPILNMVTCCIKKSYNIIDISSGSSDINAALFGLFFSALLYKYSKDKRINFMSINYTIMALFFIFLFVYYSFDLKFLLLSILIFIITIILNYNIIKNFENKKFLYVITIIIILFFLLSNFPNITIIQEMKMDIISHFLGFIYGLIISWIYFYNSIEKHKLQTIIN